MAPISVLVPHPNGIKPLGNREICPSALDGQHTDHFGRLSDELILLIFQLLPPKDIVNISHTSKRLYAFSLLEDLWKETYTQNDYGLPWRGTWRATCMQLMNTADHLQVDNIYSDLLFKPYMNTQIDLENYLPTKKSNMIPRYDNISLAEFTESCVHRPFILTDEIKNWPALSSWTTESLLSRFSDTKFRAECVDWSLSQYVSYMRENQDESPLYLFDSHFAEKTLNPETNTSLRDDYFVPECFDEDAFKILAHDRPDHRWLIVGPARSGSTFHKDPNGTCAWNAVITGSKLWIMLPPDCPPPGVYVSADESEVTAPLSIAEWLMTYHQAARATRGFMEGICGPGEILYVPSGWWHLVVNLEECIAVTQNFVPRTYIPKVLRFLRDKREQVSGFHKSVQAYELFENRLRESYPQEWAAATQVRQSKWDLLRNASAQDGGSGAAAFTFGFDQDSDCDD